MQKTIILVSAPIVKWSQRKDNIFLTVEVRDLKDEKVDLTSNSLKFSANSEGINYIFEINLFGEVVVEESKWTNYGLNVRFILSKKDKTTSYWTRLIKETHKLQYLQVDWTKYIDEDDEAEEGGKGLDDWDQNRFQNFDQGNDHGHHHGHDHEHGHGHHHEEEDEDEEEQEQEPNEGNIDDLDKEEEVQQKEQVPDQQKQEIGQEQQAETK